MAVLLFVGGAAVAVAEAASLADALRDGGFTLGLRYRYENVSDDAVGTKEAHASTLRTTLGWESAPYRGVSLLLEAENVTAVGPDLYNNAGAGSLANGVTDRPVVADPALTEVNQALLRIVAGQSEIRLGRQEILVGDQRYVGNVGWRQNHQSFDAATLIDRSLPRTVVEYSYVDAVHRIIGDSQAMSTHLLTAAVDAGGPGKLTLYGYLVDYDRRADSGLSSLTLGAELAGKADLAGERALLWEAEYADQGDAGDNPRSIAADYLHLMIGGDLGPATVKVGRESLGGSPSEGQFRTPLATLHKFNGWADKFLATPPFGLVDLYLSVTGESGRLAYTAVYHEFESESGQRSYGDELDLEVVYRAPWEQAFALKAALYRSDGFAADTSKLWLWTTYSIR